MPQVELGRLELGNTGGAGSTHMGQTTGQASFAAVGSILVHDALANRFVDAAKGFVDSFLNLIQGGGCLVGSMSIRQGKHLFDRGIDGRLD